MHVLLINPPHLEFYLPRFHRYFPLGLAYLAASIRKKHRVDIFDSLAYPEDSHISKIQSEVHTLMLSHQDQYKDIIHWGASWERCHSVISNIQPDVIGITCHMAANLYETLYLARICRSCIPSAKIVVGGGFATVRPKKFLTEPGLIDAVFIGEA